MSYRLVVQVSASVSEEVVQYVQNFARHNAYVLNVDHNKEEGYVDFSFTEDTLENIKNLWRAILQEVNQENSLIGFFKNKWIVVLVQEEDWEQYILLQSSFEENPKMIATDFLSDNFSWSDHLNNLPDSAFDISGADKA